MDESHYPGWDSLCQNLSAAGTKMMTYINPFLADTVTKDKKNFKHDQFKEAAALGYLVKKQDGSPYILASGSASFTFGMIDFTNPDATAWYSTTPKKTQGKPLAFFKMACKQNLDLRCVLISDPGTLGAGAKTRLHTPKAVTYHEQPHIMNHTF